MLGMPGAQVSHFMCKVVQPLPPLRLPTQVVLSLSGTGPASLFLRAWGPARSDIPSVLTSI